MVSGYDKNPPPEDEPSQVESSRSFWAGVLVVAVIAALAWWIGLN